MQELAMLHEEAMMKDTSVPPITRWDPSSHVVFSPKDYLQYKREVEKQQVPEIPAAGIVCFESGFVKYALDELKATHLPWFRMDVCAFLLKDHNMFLVRIPYGAALSAIAFEELICLGGRSFVFLGSAGSLQHQIPVHSVVVAKRAVREEGVSYHYAPPSKFSACSPSLLEKAKKVAPACVPSGIFFGDAWSTDSFYRETVEKAKTYQREGILCVDMEAAALYAVAGFRKVDALSIFYMSDSIADLRWNPQFGNANNARTHEALMNLAVRILQAQNPLMSAPGGRI